MRVTSTDHRHDRNIDQLASVIAAVNAGQGRDLLGVCLGSHSPLLEPVGEVQQ
jgi:hypothetical protein